MEDTHDNFVKILKKKKVNSKYIDLVVEHKLTAKRVYNCNYIDVIIGCFYGNGWLPRDINKELGVTLNYYRDVSWGESDRIRRAYPYCENIGEIVMEIFEKEMIRDFRNIVKFEDLIF